MKKNRKIVMGFMIGIIVSLTGVYAESVISSSEISYDNSNSKLSATTVQEALDETYEKITKGRDCTNFSSNCDIVAAYTYHATTCLTGEESTCSATNCYKSTAVGSCSPGTVIKYRVNNTTTKYFHVIHDDGETMTLQERENIIDNVAWNVSSNNAEGPLTALQALDTATKDWTNVNTINYTMGATNFNGTNAYTGCNLSDSNGGCTVNKYTLSPRSTKARMITIQEAVALGCSSSENSCPIWMINYSAGSITNGGSVSIDATLGYWTMSATSDSQKNTAWIIRSNKRLLYYDYDIKGNWQGIRPVVVISK